jgi:hypothetical protein
MSDITVMPDPYNSRVTIDCVWTGPAEPVALSRYDPDLEWRYVRQGNPLTFTAGAVTVDDFECPLDVGVKYAMRSETSAITYSEATLLLSQGLSWIKHPYDPSRNVRIYPTEAPNMTRTAPVGLFPILGRSTPVAVTTARGADVGTLKFATASSTENDAIRHLLSDGGIVQLAFPSGYGVRALWAACSELVENRLTHYAIEPSRIWELSFTAVERPD